MAKPAIYHTLVGSPYGGRWTVMAVTSEKPGRMVYGRDADGMGSHRVWGDRHGRFETPEQAEAAILKIERLRAAHRPGIDAAKAALLRLEHEQRTAIEDLLRENEQ